MKKLLFIAAMIGSILLIAAMPADHSGKTQISDVDTLRYLYERSSDRWPKPNLDSGVAHIELGILPGSPLDPYRDSLKPLIDLGKTMFFDPRLSASNQISCSSCHHPDQAWTDGRGVAVGHDHMRGSRNTPSIENSWYFTSLFWDGRASSLETQAPGPIENPIEMHQNFEKLPAKLAAIKGYHVLYKNAYGDKKITKDRIITALATFQRSVSSALSDFDFFMAGSKTRLSDEQIKGLHLFRTKGNCLNCHNGPLFTDNKFHNLNATFYKDEKRQDLGLYNFTNKPEDVGKFKTPSLRNVMQTGPWFHNGMFKDMRVVMSQYNAGMGMLGTIHKTPSKEDPMRPVVSPHIRTLSLTSEEISAVIAFLNALSEIRGTFDFPELPKKEDDKSSNKKKEGK
jgi:cytochrome c peroxidase